MNHPDDADGLALSDTPSRNGAFSPPVTSEGEGGAQTAAKRSFRDDDDMPDIALMLSQSIGVGLEPPLKKASLEKGVIGSNGSMGHNNTSLGPPSQAQLQAQIQASLHTPSSQHFTWIMESGRGDPPSEKREQQYYQNLSRAGLAFPMPANPYNVMFPFAGQTPAGNPAQSPFSPAHFQHLLAASSLLWANPAVLNDPNLLNLSFTPPHSAAMMLGYSGKKCSNCGATSTPSWRRCPAGRDLLCNACGLYQKLHNRPRPFKVTEDGSIRVQRLPGMPRPGSMETGGREDGGGGGGREGREETSVTKTCAHCRTTDTPLWRKVGEYVCCNACALFYKTHGFHRPLPSAASLDLSLGASASDLIENS